MSKKDFPFIVTPRDIGTISDSRTQLQNLSQTHGAVLLRGFGFSTAEDFSQAVRDLQVGSFVDYIGGDSPRTRVCPGVYTSTEAPPSVKIALHNELSFMREYPRHIFFFCETPPKERGETTIASSKQVYESIRPEVRKKFEEKGIRYTSHYPESDAWIRKINPFHKPWSVAFETTDRKEVEKRCEAQGIDYRWYPSGWLEISQTGPATLRHPVSGETIWFNQAHLFDFNPKLLGWSRYLATLLLYALPHTKLHSVAFGDGSPIPRQDIYHILDVLEQCSVYFPWQKGDLLFLDNLSVMHGRSTFQGPRRILTSMTH